AEFVSPFLEAIIRAATKNKCFVDKTIGDEVMVVMPGSLRYELLDDMFWFLADVVHDMVTSAPEISFRAGAAFGRVFLHTIEVGSYREWSVFGNCVSGAKRLQELSWAPSETEAVSRYKAVLGVLEDEQPDFPEKVQAWLDREKLSKH